MEINIGGAIRRIIALEVGNMTSKAVSKFMIFISHLSIQNRLAALALLIFCVDFPADLIETACDIHGLSRRYGRMHFASLRLHNQSLRSCPA